MGVSYCIMNRQGIAIASDTSVTIRGRTAIFENGVKIFSLGNQSKIGTMHFGDTTVLGVSDEVFMTFFRRHVEEQGLSFGSMSEAAEALVSYLQQHHLYLRLNEDEEVSVHRKIHRMIKEDLFHAIDAASDENLTRSDTIERFIELFVERIDEQCSIEGVEFAEYVYGTYRSLMTQLLKEYVNVTFTDKQLQRLHIALTKGICAIPSEHLTILFAGFCDGDLFPSSIELHLYGYYNGTIQYAMEEHNKVTELLEEQVQTTCFGECDVIYSFKHDVDQTVQVRYIQLVQEDIMELINEMDSRVLDNNDKTELFGAFQESLQSTFYYMNHQIGENVKSVDQILSRISADDLVTYARNMVNIAKVKSLYTLNQETQGTVTGDIMSAKITVYDGFEWTGSMKEGQR